MDPLLANGVALITGSGSGIGQNIALKFASNGCKKLFLADISQNGLAATEAAVKEVAGDAQVVTFICDISDEQSVAAMVNTCVGQFGRIDFACNNAGMVTGAGVTHEMDADKFERMTSVNTIGTLLCQKHELKVMLQQEPLSVSGVRHAPRGSIVNTASMAGLGVLSGLAGYSATKHGVVSMTRVDARQYAEQGIRINSVCPGFVDTPMLRGEMDEEWVKASARNAPVNRLIDPAEVANGVVFLSGSLATAVTGVSLPVDGGALLSLLPWYGTVCMVWYGMFETARSSHVTPRASPNPSPTPTPQSLSTSIAA
ncbi:oxidoreductase [Aspergillus unguis]